jgi:hydroxyethylthiazole kinase-like uncharacterized protein yjeF
MKIARVQEMRNMDKMAIEKYGLVEELLMENAGEAVFFTILNEIGIKNKNFVVFCGVGNNGGDGLVVARKLHSNGGNVIVIILGDRKNFKGAAKLNYDIAHNLNLPMYNFEELKSIKVFTDQAHCLIDAIFGTGLDREVSGKYQQAIELINTGRAKVVSVDIPSGISGDTAQIMGSAVQADYTITFGLPKIGNVLYPGFNHGGKLFVTHISFPPELHNSTDLKISTIDFVPLPARDPDSHKGSYGKVLFIAGSANYLGAPYFAAQSFLKTGGGLSYLATPESVTPFIGNKGSEIIFVPQKSTDSGSISRENRKTLVEISQQMDMVILGPGISLNEESQELARNLISEIKKPLLIDGDGITAIAQNLNLLKKRKQPTILTPHPGEMSRISGFTIEEIIRNRMDVLQKVANELQSIIILKGAHSLIGLPDGRVFVNFSGNAGMATAGSGDALTGTIAAMHGLGLTSEEAVCMGVFMHGLAGDLAAKETGQDGLVAGDILTHLPAAMRAYRERYASITKNEYHSIYTI